MAIKHVNLKPQRIESLTTENPDGLRWAVVYKDIYVIALFDTKYWAQHFIKSANQEHVFSIREVEDNV